MNASACRKFAAPVVVWNVCQIQSDGHRQKSWWWLTRRFSNLSWSFRVHLPNRLFLCVVWPVFRRWLHYISDEQTPDTVVHIVYGRTLEVVWYSSKKSENINACICNDNTNERIGKKDDFVVVEGSNKLDDQWRSDHGIFHLQWERYRGFNRLSVDLEEKEEKIVWREEESRNDLLHLMLLKMCCSFCGWRETGVWIEKWNRICRRR